MIRQDIEIVIESPEKKLQEDIALQLGVRLIHLSELKNIISLEKCTSLPGKLPREGYVMGLEETRPRINHTVCRALRDSDTTLLLRFPAGESKRWGRYIMKTIPILEHYHVRYLLVSLSENPWMMSSRQEKEGFIKMILENHLARPFSSCPSHTRAC